MKNTVKLFGLIAIVTLIGFSMTACEEEGPLTLRITSTNGTLIISGLSEWNDKYVLVTGIGGVEGENTLFYAFANLPIGDYMSTDASPVAALGQIKNGSVSLKVWKQLHDFEEDGKIIYDLMTNYNGNDQNVKFDFMIYDNVKTYKYWDWGLGGVDYVGSGWLTVNFTNGYGTGIVQEVYPNN